MARTTLRQDQTRFAYKHGTTDYWNAAVGFIPQAGEIVVYDDYSSEVVDGVTVYYPNIKIGTGNAYIQDLPFLGQQETTEMLEHINNTGIHITAAERVSWNARLNVNDNQETIGETLIFIRN